MNPLLCEWDVAQFLIFSNNGEPLIYYSHLTSIFIFLGLIGFTFLKLRPWPKNTFRLMALSYVVWLTCDLVLWANEIPQNVMFFWSIINLVEPLIFVFAFAYFFHFAEGRPISKRSRWLIFLLLIPTLIMAPIGLSTVGFDMTTCDRNVIEGVAAYYNYFLEALFLGLVVLKTITFFFKKTAIKNRGKLLFMSVGTSLLMFSFLIANFLGTFTGDYVTSQYGHIAVPIFAAFLAYVTIKYESFEPRILLTDILVGSLLILLLSLLFVRQPEYQIYANVLAFIIMAPLGYTLVTNIRREVRIRKEIESLAKNLENANVRLKELDKTKSEFLSIASHQLRTPLAAIRGYISMIQEGDFGKPTAKMEEPLQQLVESSRLMNTSIEDYLNVSRIEQGRMVYTMQDVNLKDLIRTVVAELIPASKRRGLSLTTTLDTPSTPQNPVTNADLGKIKQVISNLIDNAIKYTKEGSITVSLSEVGSMLRITITDTGVGIEADEIGKLFSKFTRAKDAGLVNTSGTGLGLYVAKQIIEAHKGSIRVESAGIGKGSCFVVEIPKKS